MLGLLPFDVLAAFVSECHIAATQVRVYWNGYGIWFYRYFVVVELFFFLCVCFNICVLPSSSYLDAKHHLSEIRIVPLLC